MSQLYPLGNAGSTGGEHDNGGIVIVALRKVKLIGRSLQQIFV